MPARAAIPWRNSSGKVASEDSSTPSARRPFHVKRDAYPSGVRLVGLEAFSGADFFEESLQPFAAACGVLKGEEFVSGYERAWTPHQEMLNIVELKHWRFLKCIPMIARQR